jgi:predicted GTPase
MFLLLCSAAVAAAVQVCKIVIEAARSVGKKVVLVRHPMPYGDLAKQVRQQNSAS